MKMIGSYGIKEHQKIVDYYNTKESMAYVLLNYNFVHVVLKNQWARPKTCYRKTAGLERWKNGEEVKKGQNRKGKTRKDDS